MQACRTNPSRVERIPLVPTCAGPTIILVGSPAAERTADTGTGRIVVLFPFGLGVENGIGIGPEVVARHRDIMAHAFVKSWLGDKLRYSR
jgi:hypothetical protein